MAGARRETFRSQQDWHDYLNKNGQSITLDSLKEMRESVYGDIEDLRGRPLLVYAAKFVSAPNINISSEILGVNLQDIDGFTDLVSSIDDKHDFIDVLIHSPGGDPAATERIVGILRGRFKEVHFLVPHSAYSAATMLALSGDTVTLHSSATLGPIDPQININDEIIPARLLKKSFENLEKRLIEDGSRLLSAYFPLIDKYDMHTLELCDDSIDLAKNLLSDWLMRYMFKAENTKTNAQIVSNAVDFFSSYDEHLLHSRPITYAKIKSNNLHLEIHPAENKLSELLRESYILLEGLFSLSPTVKIYENKHGVSWGTQMTIKTQQDNRQEPVG